MGKIEKWHLLPRYFEETSIEMFFEKTYRIYILAHCLFVLVAMETVNEKNGKRKCLKNYLFKNHKLCEAETL